MSQGILDPARVCEQCAHVILFSYKRQVPKLNSGHHITTTYLRDGTKIAR